MRKAIILLVILVLAIFAGCTASNPPQTGLANPASVYCQENGGKLEIITEEAGQRGICILKDGTRCDEWAYYRGECQQADNNCGQCALLTPPSPDWCKTGNIVEGKIDKCGCRGPPICEQVACTYEAKLCPDGSAVGRIGPDCEFAPCPGSN